MNDNIIELCDKYSEKKETDKFIYVVIDNYECEMDGSLDGEIYMKICEDTCTGILGFQVKTVKKRITNESYLSDIDSWVGGDGVVDSNDSEKVVNKND